MDEIYDNLENYNDVNILNELKTENRELKFKLEECSTSMERLQKDFDKLAAEFKKLETNYSSLLKTARAEIERKTHIIKNLNMEKDMMVLNSIQNIRQSRFQVQKQADLKLRKNSDSDSIPGRRNMQSSVDKPQLHRLSEKRVPSEDTISSYDIESNKMANERNLNSKDYFTKEKYSSSDTQAKALGIGNRRKSMPLLSRQYPQLSSDEEYEVSGEACKEKYFFSKNDIDRNKSEISYSDDKKRDKDQYNRYDRSCETRDNSYRSRNKCQDDRYRREGYEQAQRRNRHYSPKRQHRNEYTDDDHHRRSDYDDDHKRRSNYGRGRVVVSPAPEKYNRKRSRDRRSNYEKAYHENYDRDRNHYEKQKIKKDNINSDHDEPLNKKLKTSLVDKYPDRDIEELISDTNQLVSCESPDYIQSDNLISAQPVKEIMNTAAIELEDPRLTSRRYTTLKNGDKTILSSVTGRNIDLQILNTTTWEKVNIPQTLLYEVSQFSDQTVKEIYMDLDNPVSNTSIESGEVLDLEIDDNDSKDLKNDSRSNRKEEQAILQKEPCGNTESPVYAKANTSKYKIPKIKKSVNSVAELRKDTTNVFSNSNFCDNLETNCHISTDRDNNFKKTGRQIKNSNDNLSDIMSDDEDFNYETNLTRILSDRDLVQNDLELSDDNIPPINEEAKIIPAEVSVSKKHKNKKPHKLKKGSKDSDVTSPECNLVNAVLAENNAKIRQLYESNNCLKSSEDEGCSNKSTLKNLETKSFEKTIECTTEARSPQNTTIINTDKLLSVDKNNTTNKNRESPVAINTKFSDKKDESLCSPVDKKTKSKKKEDVAEDIKTKFSDLFGDSNSLITPEDLQIATSEAHGIDRRINMNPLVFENIQSQAGFNLNEIDNSDAGKHLVTRENVTNNNKEIAKTKTCKTDDIDLTVVEGSVTRLTFVKETDSHQRSKYEKINSLTVVDQTKKELTVKKPSTKLENDRSENRIEASTDNTVQNIKDSFHKNSKQCTKIKRSQKPLAMPVLNEHKKKESKTRSTSTDHVDQANEEITFEPPCSKLQNVQSEKSHSIEASVDNTVQNKKENCPQDSKESTKLKRPHKPSTTPVLNQHKKKETKPKSSKVHAENKSKPKQSGETKVSEVNNKKNIDIISIDCDVIVNTVNTHEVRCKTQSHIALLGAKASSKNDETNEKINCNAVISNEPDVLKTVIISSGFQPQLETGSVETNSEQKQDKIQNDLITILRIQEDSIKALATSTPQKEIQERCIQPQKSQITDPSCSDRELTNISSSAVSESLDLENEKDVPDVRIFVKRRRRVIKKTT